MPLTPGETLTHYEILGPLGAGGMGEVYRAKDTRLDREVAIKVLPEELADDGERSRRFEREARTLASLSHTNLAHVYGIDQVDDTCFIAMELVPGEDLATKLARGPLPIDEAVDTCRQIAEGLEAAHEAGVVHRDLKPANVRVTPEGVVKILDFGLAKPIRPSARSGSGATAAESDSFLMTEEGLVLGTPTYMSPEQARGKLVDRRTDIWALGCVLFECLTGRRAFDGETFSDVLASIVQGEADWSALPAGTPAQVTRLLRRCLDKDARARLRDVGEARIALAGNADAGTDAGASHESQQAKPARRVALAGWAIALVLAAVLVVLFATRGATPAPEARSFELALAAAPDTSFRLGSNAGWGVVSPDGRWVVAPVSTAEGDVLWLRSLERDEGHALPGSEQGLYPFWSPDSRTVAFFAPNVLMRVNVDGGLPERICAVSVGRGGSWSPAGRILLTPGGGGAVHVVPASGGEPRPVTRVEHESGESAHYWPQWLPDGEHFLYFLRSTAADQQGVYLGTVRAEGVDVERRRVVASSSSGLFVRGEGDEPDRLLWVEGGALLARAFDWRSGTLSGPTTPVAEGVRVLESQRASMVSCSADGTLVWGSSRFGTSRLAWFGRDGSGPEFVDGTEGALYGVQMSPNGETISLLRVEEGQGDIWLLDVATGRARPLTATPDYEERAVWSPDSTELLIRRGGGTFASYVRARVDGTGGDRTVLTDEAGLLLGGAWLPNGWFLVIAHADGETRLQLGNLEETELQPRDFLSDPGDQFGVSVAPQLDAFAFSRASRGKREFVVAPLSFQDGRPVPGASRQPLGIADVTSLRWSGDGSELFALTSVGAFLSVPIERRGGRLAVGEPVELFHPTSYSFGAEFAPTLDGQRFLFLVAPDAARESLQVLVDWQERLRTPR